MKRLVLAGMLLSGLGWAGCNIDFSSLLGLGGELPQARLEPFQSADELRDYLVEQSQPTQRGGDILLFDGDLELAADDTVAAPTADGGDGAGGNRSEESASDSPDFSTTTEQEVGVQEADVFKSDGDYLYIITGQTLQIVQARPAGSMSVAGKVPLNGYGRDVYLAGDTVVTVTTGSNQSFARAATDAVFAPEFYEPQLEVTIIDASDRTAPVIKSRVVIDGSLLNSRLIGRRLYLVSVNYPEFIAFAEDGIAVTTAVAGAPEPMAQEEVTLESLLPDIRIDVDGVTLVEGDIAKPDEHYRPVDPDGLGMTSLLSIDLDAPQDYQAQTLVSYPSDVYASPNAIYLTDTAYRFDGSSKTTTNIYKFAITDAGTQLAASGTIPGRVLNQYSMSEYNGFLRVAVSQDRTFGPLGQTSPTTNDVYVLEQDGTDLTVAGSVTDLAPGETIFSARFVADKGYLVTFEQVDPLFTLDLSDPRNPRAVGELKVPGFSTFILPMDDDHLLTIGRHTDETQGRVFPEGVRLSIFDVSDFANPELMAFEVIGPEGVYSEALFNAKAFTYFPSGNLFALPIEIYNFGFLDEPGVVVFDGGGERIPTDDGIFEDGGAGQSTGSDGGTGDVPPSDDPPVPPADDVPAEDEPIDEIPVDLPPVPLGTFSGLYVYEVSPTDGFTFVGRLSTVDPEDNPYGYSGEFTRGAFIGDTLYAVTSESVTATTVEDVETVLGEVRFELGENDRAGDPEPGVDEARE